ncbi:MAG: 16S rRNA (guanine(966)-N(2))-methyltransferase RsmD [Acidaminococcaceae bacterium]
MRIITGKARGLKLITPKNMDVRPTSDRVKESLFNIIGTKIVGTRVLDLFAGTGNLGLEAWSRGAEKIVFVDDSTTSLQLVRSNISKAKAEKETQVINGNAAKIIASLTMKGEKFDFIFCDPPYNKGLPAQIIEQVAKYDIVVSGGYLIVEHSQHEILPELPEKLENIRNEKYGETLISFLRCK